MKNNRLRVFLTLCVIAVLSIFVGSFSAVVVNASTIIPATNIATETPPAEDGGVDEGDGLEGEGEGEEQTPNTPAFEGFAITTSVIWDEYLYAALLQAYSDYFESINGVAYSGTTIYSDMFIGFTELNLDKKNITSLEGMEKLELENLVTFSANSNAIAEFKGEFLETTEDWTFTNLYLADNKIKTVDFDGLIGLKNINLSSNKLTAVDFTVIEGQTSGSTLTINLANNSISDFNNIKLPTRRISHYNINIINNNIVNIPDKCFTDEYTMNIGIQGFNSDSVQLTDTATNLVIYKTNVEGLKVVVYKVDGEVDEFIGEFSDADITGNSLRLNLKVGKYKFIYKLNDADAYSKDYAGKYYLKHCELNVVPQNLVCKFIHKNKEYSELGKVTGKVTVKLSSNDAGAKIFYKVNNGEWIEGDTVLCENGGNYSIIVKAVVDGVESPEQNVWVRTSLNLYIPDALMLVLVALLALVLFLVVLPIVSRKYFKKD